MFKAFRGSSIQSGAHPFYEHTFTARVPSPGEEHLEFMFYIVASENEPRQKNTEVIIDNFEYLP